MKKSLISSFKMSVWGLLAMTCISCAHQSKDASLMIDKEAPSEEHVWSETREVQETIANQDKSEEDQLAEMEADEENKQPAETSPQASNDSAMSPSEEVKSEEVASSELAEDSDSSTGASLASNEEMKASDEIPSESELSEKSGETQNPMLASNDFAKADEGSNNTPEEVKPESSLSSESPQNASREVASEPPADELTPPSQVQPTIGVPARLKTDDRVPSKKPSGKSRTFRGNDNAVAALKVPMEVKTLKPQEPKVEIVAQEEMTVKPMEPVKAPSSVNALGEEEESTPQLASVEIATFLQNHWAAVMTLAGVVLVGLFFMMRKKSTNEM